MSVARATLSRVAAMRRSRSSASASSPTNSAILAVNMCVVRQQQARSWLLAIGCARICAPNWQFCPAYSLRAQRALRSTSSPMGLAAVVPGAVVRQKWLRGMPSRAQIAKPGGLLNRNMKLGVSSSSRQLVRRGTRTRSLSSKCRPCLSVKLLSVSRLKG